MRLIPAWSVWRSSVISARPRYRWLKYFFRRLLHSIAYFLASVGAMALFVFVLMLAESLIYVLTGTPISTWAMVIAGIAAAFGFAPAVDHMQRWMDRLFFPRHINMTTAISQLGAEELADLSVEDVEVTLLARICKVTHRRYAALDERECEGGGTFVYPPDAPAIPAHVRAPGPVGGYEVCLPLRHGHGRSYLLLGPGEDGWPLSADERRGLEGLARFVAMSLEHARLTRRQLQEARLDSLSRITRQLHSHDLKNRLHDLTFLAHHLQSGRLEKEEVEQLVSAIGKVAGRMQTLMQRIADPNAPLHPCLVALDLRSLIARTVRERLWPEGVELVLELADVPPVAGDADLLRGVLENLYDNAVQAMNSKGRLQIVLRSVVQHDQAMAEVRVRDTGCGIPPEFLRQKLFQLFATSKAKGLGVGLYLSRRIMLAHHGSIEAESAGPGKGATFILRLPLWRDEKAGEER